MGFEIDLRSFSHCGNTIEYSLIPWDTEIFGYSVIEISAFLLGDPGRLSETLESFDKHIASLHPRVIYVKIEIDQRELLDTLLRNGYIFIEETVQPYINDLQTSGFDYSKHIVYPLMKAGEAALPGIQDIAATTFTDTRFYVDKNFGADQASSRYVYWINNSFSSGDEVLYLDVGGTIAGFSIIRFAADGAFLSLIGMGNTFKGSGLGMNLYAASCQYVRDKGLNNFTSTISFNNIRALNMHVKCGFKFKKPLYVLHKWI